jgi:hypothetical protein
MEAEPICAIEPSSTPRYYIQSRTRVLVRIVEFSLTDGVFHAWLYIVVSMPGKFEMEATISSWMNNHDTGIWGTYYGFACHLQVVLDINRESCMLEHITWRFQLLKWILTIALLRHGLNASINPCEHEPTLWEGLNWRLWITNDLPTPSCDMSMIVKSYPAAVTFVYCYFLYESGRHAEWELYSSCIWNRIERFCHTEAVARYWQILTGLHLYCTISICYFFFALVAGFLAMQYKEILNCNGSYSTYNVQSSIQVYGLLRINKLPVCKKYCL